jgi:hypothetical protein
MTKGIKIDAEVVARCKAAARLIGPKRVSRITGIPTETIGKWMANGPSRNRKDVEPDPWVAEALRRVIVEGTR